MHFTSFLSVSIIFAVVVSAVPIPLASGPGPVQIHPHPTGDSLPPFGPTFPHLPVGGPGPVMNPPFNSDQESIMHSD